jgi:hypothetical protein
MKESLEAHRRRMMKKGMKRVEVCARQTDAELIRHVARTLATDDAAAERLRTAIHSSVPPRCTLTFKEWMESLPNPDEQ